MEVDMRQVSQFATMITDASHCPNTKAGGWASWTTRNGVRYKYCGALKGLYDSSNEAEFAAICNGLFMLLQNKVVRSGDTLLIQSDNTTALNWTGAERSGQMPVYEGMTAKARDLRMRFRELVNDNNLRIRARHVKGHQSNQKGARYYVNNWCDEQAGYHMRKLRQKLRSARRSA